MSFKERLKEHAELTERRLDELLALDRHYQSFASEKLIEAMRYSLLGGGKRLRAFLTLQFCLACGGKLEDALDYACAMEMVHAFSLIHDDLPAMDNDDMRRGKPSNHKAFGEATAILAGDALAIDAFRVIVNNKKCSPEQNALAVAELSLRAGGQGMCAGQQRDLDGEGRELTREELNILVSRKTSDLFEAACRLGVIAAGLGAESNAFAAVTAFAYYLGRAFQIVDDLLDIESTNEQMGKTVGKDIAAEKSTFPALMGVSPAREYASELIQLAKDVLCDENFAPSVYRDELIELCDYVLNRTN